jgi:flagellar motor switch protein FliG
LLSSANQLRKVAALLLSLPSELAASLLARLDAAEVAALAREIANSRPASDAEQKAAVVEFVEATAATNLIVKRDGSVRAHAPLAATSDGGHPQPEHFPAAFDFLRHFDAAFLSVLLAEEQPQTIALVASCLPRRLAASVIAAMPVERQSEIIRRIASIDEPDGQSVLAVARTLDERLSDPNCANRGHSGRQAALAEIFGHAEPGIRSAALGRLTRHDPELARQIQRLILGRQRIGQRLVS